MLGLGDLRYTNDVHCGSTCRSIGGGGGYFHVLIAIVVIVGMIVSHGKGHHPASRTDVNFALVNG